MLSKVVQKLAITRTLTKVCAVNATKSICNKSILIRSFSGKKLANKKLSLEEILKTEIDLENKQERVVNEEYETVKSDILKHFKVEESDGLGLVHLTSTFNGNETIKVSFDVQDEAEIEPEHNYDEEAEDEEGEEEEDAEEDEDDDMESATGINLDIEVSKGGDSLVFSCVASNSLEIQNIRHVPAGKDKTDGALYGGPDFSTLVSISLHYTLQYSVPCIHSMYILF